MIRVSYCIPVYRPMYAKILINDLIRKTTLPYEILVWMNVYDGAFLAFLDELVDAGHPVFLVGISPENIGMQSFKIMFPMARGEVFVQLDDDVLAISPRAAEIALEIFERNPECGIVGGHVWQDEWTTGGRPLLKYYLPHDSVQQLYLGPIDGGFTVYRRELHHLIKGMRKAEYFALGVEMVGRASELGIRAFLTPRILFFHVVGAVYTNHFGMLDFEIEKYRKLERRDVVLEYEEARKSLPPKDEIVTKILNIHHAIDTWGTLG